MKTFSFVSLLFLILLTTENTFAGMTEANIKLRCGTATKPATLMMEFDSINWSLQCDDVDYGYKSDVWVHPGNILFQVGNESYEYDPVESEIYNHGTLSSYSNDDVSCSKVMIEYPKKGLSWLSWQYWTVPTTGAEHSFVLKNSNGDLVTLTLSLKNYYSSILAAKGSAEFSVGSEKCNVYDN